LRARRTLLLENLALRQPLVVRKRRQPRPRLGVLDKLFWVAARRFWSRWKPSLIVVTHATVVRWHRVGFRLYGRLISRVRRQVGRKPTSKQVRELIFRRVVENPPWGAPRLHGELRRLGFEVSERTISRGMKRAPRRPDRTLPWRAFVITGRRSPRWLSSPFPHSPSGCFTASWLSAMIGAVFCTSTSRRTRRALGSSSNSGKPFPSHRCRSI